MSDAVIKKYDEGSIANLYNDAPENGFSIIVIPAFSPTHFSFALKAPTIEGFATKPLIGWISGFDLADVGTAIPKVFAGEKVEDLSDGAVAMHISLPAAKFAEVKIVNIFRQGTGDVITFPLDGFESMEALINGKKRNLVEYLAEKKADTRLPLVADYAGAMINVSFQTVDAEKKKVTFYAPVFRDIEYKLAKPVGDYVALFDESLPNESPDRIFFSCNCILNYLHSRLEGRRTGPIIGPMTFGEIAYQLLNQTMVYVIVGDL